MGFSTLRDTRAPIFHSPTGNPHTLVSDFPSDYDRVAGLADVFATEGIRIADVPLVEACGSLEDEAIFGSAARLLLDRAPEVTAVIALSDVLALSVLGEARRRGLVVPRDLSVVGFDDNPESALADPPLTTVAQPTAELGAAAARILFEGGSPQHLTLPVQLVVRKSTGPSPA